MAGYAVVALLVVAAGVALLVLVVWAIARAVAAAGRTAAAKSGEQRPWSAQGEAQEPIIDVTATEPSSELAEVIRENNRLLREILDELRRGPEGSPSASSEHLG